MNIQIPKDVETLMETLNQSNFESYVVGGCVRDSLLGLMPKDWDICTNALPEIMLGIFESKGYKVIPTGLKHGTITVMHNEVPYEITTYRVDGKYTDCRRPDCVDFVASLEEDLSRRDFTINAMAYNDFTGLIDYFGGADDLREKKIKAVGNPDERFKEDPLRMMRAARFSSDLYFDIDIKTMRSIARHKDLILKVSGERIRDELIKILVSLDPCRGLEVLRMSRLMEAVLPELQACYGFNQHNPNHDKDIYHHTLAVIENTSNDLEVRLAALLHDIGKVTSFSMDEEGVGHFYKHHLDSEEMARDILTRLRFDNKTIECVCLLVREHMSRYSHLRTSKTKKFINRIGVENLDLLFQLQIADIQGGGKNNDISDVFKLSTECEKILETNQPLSVKDLAVNGTDLMEIGFQQGKKLGQTLNYLLDLILENPENNTKEYLIKMAKENA